MMSAAFAKSNDMVDFDRRRYASASSAHLYAFNRFKFGSFDFSSLFETRSPVTVCGESNLSIFFRVVAKPSQTIFASPFRVLSGPFFDSITALNDVARILVPFSMAFFSLIGVLSMNLFFMVRNTFFIIGSVGRVIISNIFFVLLAPLFLIIVVAFLIFGSPFSGSLAGALSNTFFLIVIIVAGYRIRSIAFNTVAIYDASRRDVSFWTWFSGEVARKFLIYRFFSGQNIHRPTSSPKNYSVA